jgi:acyl-homoserine lactone synthase
MFHIVTPENEYHYRDETDQTYRLRHRVFVEKKGWLALGEPDWHEIEQFDNEHAVHMLYIAQGKVLGYATRQVRSWREDRGCGSIASCSRPCVR